MKDKVGNTLLVGDKVTVARDRYTACYGVSVRYVELDVGEVRAVDGDTALVRFSSATRAVEGKHLLLVGVRDGH